MTVSRASWHHPEKQVHLIHVHWILLLWYQHGHIVKHMNQMNACFARSMSCYPMGLQPIWYHRLSSLTLSLTHNSTNMINGMFTANLAYGSMRHGAPSDPCDDEIRCHWLCSSHYDVVASPAPWGPSPRSGGCGRRGSFIIYTSLFLTVFTS